MKEGSEADGTKSKEPAVAALTTTTTTNIVVAPTAVIVNHSVSSLHHSADSNSSTGSANHLSPQSTGSNNSSTNHPSTAVIKANGIYGDDPVLRSVVTNAGSGIAVSNALAALRAEVAASVSSSQASATNALTPNSPSTKSSSSSNGLTASESTDAPDSAQRDAAGSRGNGTPKEKVFVCNICDRCFGYKHVLQNHQRTHTGEKPFQCYMCFKKFTRDHHLKTHMRLHTGEKPYHCTQCERKFVQVANLRRHLRVHTGERPYACGFCSSRFSDSNQLKAHVLIHKGEKPFECKKCLGRFRRRHHLMHHKCPKDEANLGKPRRGRRPKAYDDLPTANAAFPTSEGFAVSESKLQTETIVPSRSEVCSPVAFPTTAAAVLAATGSTAFLHLPPQLPAAALPLVPPPPMVQHKSRRKPPHTIRILTPAQKELFINDTETIQTQPLDMSVNTSSNGTSDSSATRGSSSLSSSMYRATSPMEGVLDLSNSRSDSEPEAIEEEVEADDVDEEDEDDLDEGPHEEGTNYDFDEEIVQNLRVARLHKHRLLSHMEPREKDIANCHRGSPHSRFPTASKDGNGYGNSGGLSMERESTRTNGIIRLAKS